MKYFVLVFISVLISCTDSYESRDNHIADNMNIISIAIDGSSINDTLDVSNLIDSIRIIKIKESEDGLFGGIEKLILAKDKYVIFDPHFSNRILIFNNNGDFHKNLVSMGSGPEEMTKLSDVWINETGELEVYDNYLNKIITYNSDLNVERTKIFKTSNLYGSLIRMPKKTDFIVFSGYNGFFQSNDFFKLAILDSGFNAKNHLLPYKKKLHRALISTPISPFFIFNDTVRFTQNFDPSVYKISPDGALIKKYDLIYSPNPFPLNFERDLVIPNLSIFTSELIDFTAMKKIFSGYTGYKGPWLESSKFAIFSSFDVNNTIFTSIYDKDRKEILYQAFNFSETDRYHMQIPPHFYTTHVSENRFISMYEGFYVLLLLKESSPFYEMVAEDTESFYIIDIKLK